VYWPLADIDPAPELASPPETDHETVAAPPPASVAENCSIAVPEVFVVLQPVQLVSIATVPGVIENVPFEELLEPAAPPTQPVKTSADARAQQVKARFNHLALRNLKLLLMVEK
jgi:hypothetical protein